MISCRVIDKGCLRKDFGGVNEHVEVDRKTEVKAVMSFVLILGIFAFTTLGILLLVLNRRVAKEDDKQRMVPAVEVVSVAPSPHTVKISTQGVVESARETRLAAELGGRVMEISPSLRRGGLVKKGERLVQIDPSDYRAALATAEVRRAEAVLALEQEKARVEQARLDWQKLGTGTPTNSLVLREPYLAAAQATVEAATGDAAKARRDVERTEILAPFDAGVRSAAVEVGSVVAPGTMVAELYASSDLEVRLPLSLEDFGFLERDAAGTVVLKGKIGAEDHIWKAETVRVDPEIGRETLSAHIVVRVLETEGDEFPLPPVGLFVRAEISGMTVTDVSEIPRRALLEGNRVILADKGNKIAFRQLDIVRLTRDTAVARGLEAGERIVLTRLSAPVAGMEVEIGPGTEKEDE